jgi:sulfur relay (sulfurtransferase) DsrC/TusE family protein
MALIDDLISYYKLDETSGAVIDSTDNGNNGTNVGAIPNQEGIIGTSYNFTENQYVDTNYTGNSTLNDEITVSMWVYPMKSEEIRTIFAKNVNAGDRNFELYVDSLKPLFLTGGIESFLWGSQTLDLNEWNMITITYSKSDEKAKMYINGAFDNETTHSSSLTSNTNSYRIGNYNLGAMSGKIDEVGIWSRALTSTEVSDLYNSGDGLAYPFGKSYDKTYSESYSLSSSVNKAPGRSLSQAFNFSDGDIKSFYRILTNSFNISASKTKEWSLNRDISESFSLSSSVNKAPGRSLSQAFNFSDGDIKSFYRILTNSFNISASKTKEWSLNRDISESFSLSEDILKQIIKLKLISESFSLSEDILKQIIKLKLISESLNISEDLLLTATINLPGEQINLLDNYSKIITLLKNYSESLSLSDLIAKSLIREVSEEYSLSDTKTFQESRIINETTNLSDNQIRLIERLILEEFNIMDGDIKSFYRTLSENYGLVGDYSKIINLSREYSESFSISDSKIKSIQRIISDSLNISDLKTNQVYKMFLENNLLNDEKIFEIQRELLDTLNLSSDEYFSLLRELSETLNLSDGDTTQIITKILTESFNFEDNFIKFITNWLRSNSIKSDIQSIIQTEGISATLIRQTETIKPMGDTSAVSEEEYSIYIATQDILRSDRQMRDMGLALPGTERVFMFHEYPNSITGNGTLIPQTGDLIKDDEDIYWRIEEITAEREMEGSEIFKSALIKKVDLTQ